MCFLAKKIIGNIFVYVCLTAIGLLACKRQEINELLKSNEEPVFYLEGTIDNKPFKQIAGEGYYMYTWYEKIDNHYFCKGALKPNQSHVANDFFLEWTVGLNESGLSIQAGEYPFRLPNGIKQKELVDVSFTTLPNGKMPATYLWEMGDGTISTIPQPTHTYQPATGQQSFLAKVTINYQNACISSHQRPIFMKPLACASDFITTKFVSTPLKIRFVGISSQITPPLAYKWYFGNLDSITTTTNEIEYTFPNAGTYPVQLHILNVNGCVAKIERNVIAGDDPEHCATNFSYVASKRIAFDTIREELNNTTQITWQDSIGNKFSSYHINANGTLKIEEVTDYIPNLSGQSTKKLKVSLNTYLYNGAGVAKKIEVQGYIAVAIP